MPRIHCLLISSLAACATPAAEPAPVAPAPPAPPAWVTAGSGATNGETGRSLVGVGTATDQNAALARMNAEGNARTELAEVIAAFSAKALAGGPVASAEPMSEPGHVDECASHVPTVPGVTIAQRWSHPDGTLYALAQVKLDSVLYAVANDPCLAAEQKTWIAEHAAEAHAQLAHPD